MERESLRDKYSKIVSGILIAETAHKTVKSFIQNQKAKRTYSVTIAGDDELFEEAERWLLSILPTTTHKQISARTEQRFATAYLDAGSRKPKAIPVKFVFDSTTTNKIKIEGYDIEVSPTKPDLSGKQSLEIYKAEIKLHFTTKSIEGLEAIKRHLIALNEKKYQEKTNPRFYLCTRWGDWQYQSEEPIRPLDTVILADGQKERILSRFDEFLASEERYTKFGKPYHFGVLLHGHPGTGKTSLVRALAAHYGLDIYYLPLGEINGDADLLRTIAAVPARSVLLLEDADRFNQTSDSDADGKSTVTLSGLLNALDGIATPHGMITCITANDRSRLDPALIRPGRMDLEEELGYVDQHMFDGLCELVFDQKSKTTVPKDKPAAEIINVLSSCDSLDDALAILDAEAVARPAGLPAVPLVVDEDLKVREPTSMGIRELLRADG